MCIRDRIQLIKADGNNETIWIINDGKHLIIDGNGYSNPKLITESNYPYKTSNNISTVLWPDRIEINDLIPHYGVYKSLSLIDLENDGFSEIVAVDEMGDIYAFDNNFVLKSGFPIRSNTNGPILAINLLGDDSPELIYQDKLGIIQILDNEGKKLDEIATSTQLKGLGVYNGRHAIITSRDLILFNDDRDGFLNEWNYRYSTPDNSRYLKTITPIESSFIIDLDQTYAYPNPSFSENVIFRIHVGLAESLSIKIFDIAGFLVENFPIDISSLAYEDGSPKPYSLEELKPLYYRPTEEILAEFNKDRLKPGSWNMAWIRALSAFDIRDAIKKVRVPSLVVFGEAEAYRQHEQYFLDSIPNVQIVIVSRSAHVPHQEAPMEFLEKTLPFLKRHAHMGGL